MGKLKIGAQALALCVGMNWAAGAESRQGFGQEAALGECELSPLLNPCSNGHRPEGILTEVKGRHFAALSPWLCIFKGI